jgi:hypothetical protein
MLPCLLLVATGSLAKIMLTGPRQAGHDGDEVLRVASEVLGDVEDVAKLTVSTEERACEAVLDVLVR